VAGDREGPRAEGAKQQALETDQTAAGQQGAGWRNAEPEMNGLRVEYGGDVFEEMEAPAAELIGLASAIVILILL
jgi:hypothetical protein